MSHFPGKKRSGIRAAYKAAPVIYNAAIKNNQPICPIVAALKNPSDIIKCRVGTTPLSPNPTKTPRNKWMKYNKSHAE